MFIRGFVKRVEQDQKINATTWKFRCQTARVELISFIQSNAFSSAVYSHLELRKFFWFPHWQSFSSCHSMGLSLKLFNMVGIYWIPEVPLGLVLVYPFAIQVWCMNMIHLKNKIFKREQFLENKGGGAPYKRYWIHIYISDDPLCPLYLCTSAQLN